MSHDHKHEDPLACPECGGTERQLSGQCHVGAPQFVMLKDEWTLVCNCAVCNKETVAFRLPTMTQGFDEYWRTYGSKVKMNSNEDREAYVARQARMAWGHGAGVTDQLEGNVRYYQKRSEDLAKEVSQTQQERDQAQAIADAASIEIIKSECLPNDDGYWMYPFKERHQHIDDAITYLRGRGFIVQDEDRNGDLFRLME